MEYQEYLQLNKSICWRISSVFYSKVSWFLQFSNPTHGMYCNIQEAWTEEGVTCVILFTFQAAALRENEAWNMMMWGSWSGGLRVFASSLYRIDRKKTIVDLFAFLYIITVDSKAVSAACTKHRAHRSSYLVTVRTSAFEHFYFIGLYSNICTYATAVNKSSSDVWVDCPFKLIDSRQRHRSTRIVSTQYARLCETILHFKPLIVDNDTFQMWGLVLSFSCHRSFF